MPETFTVYCPNCGCGSSSSGDCVDVYGTISPDAETCLLVEFNGGAPIPPGQYRVKYVTGAFQPGNFPPFDRWGAGTCKVAYDAGTSEVQYPTWDGGHDTQIEVVAAYLGTDSGIFNHAGGTIGMYVDDFANRHDNTNGDPLATFQLERCGDYEPFP